MSILQETFYVIAILYMTVMLMVVACVFAAVLVIRHKVKKYLKLASTGKNSFAAFRTIQNVKL